MKRLLILAELVWAFALSAASTAMPIGIPAPVFGMTNEAPAYPSPWTDQQYQFYFINGATGSDAGNNTNGTPGAPRATVPTGIPAGSVIVISNTYGSGDITWRMAGTASEPIFVKSFNTSLTAIKGDVYLGATNTIIDYLHFQDVDGVLSGGTGGFLFMDLRCENVAIRSCKFTGNLGWGGLSTGQFVATQPAGNILILSNNITLCGDVNSGVDQDRHGIVASFVTNLWVLYNESATNSGDGIQINGGSSLLGATNTHHIYVGGNYFHHNKQAGAWSKQARDVVFSQNRVHDHWPGNSSSGYGLGFQYDPESVWFLFNTVSNCAVGIGSGSGDVPINGTNHYYIGNVICRVTNYAFIVTGGKNHHFVNNTIVEANNGLYCPYAFTFNLLNNIYSGTTNRVIDFDNHPGGEFKNNLYFKSGADTAFYWDGLLKTGLSAWQTATSREQSSISNNPVFVSTTDFHLQTSSPAKDTGLAPTSFTTDVYVLYQSLYGVNISKDIEANSRPVNSWDMGAFEFGSGSVGSSILSGATISGGRVQ